MKTSTAIAWPLVAGLFACASVDDDRGIAAMVEEPPLEESVPDAESEAAERSGQSSRQAMEASVSEPVRQRSRDLSVWNDPTFKRRFIESYLAETEVEPSVTADERDVMLEIIDLISADETDEAVDLLLYERTDESSAVFDFTLANIYFQQERFAEAAREYRVAVHKFPKFRRAWGNLGQIHFRENRFEEAVDAFSRVISLGGGDAIVYGLLGVAHSRRSDDVAAETAFRMAIMLAPDTLDWKMGLAESFFNQERYADAVSLFGSLLAEYPDRVDLWLAQGEAYARLEQPMKAAENFEIVDSLGGSTSDSLNNLGDIYANQELFDMAVNAYLRAMENSPKARPDRAIRAAKYLSANGALVETRGLVEGIESILGEKLETEERKDLLKLRARIAVAEGAGEEEARVLEQIVELDPLDGEALILLGQHANRSGDPERAVFYFERAASIEAYEADAKVRHAQLLVGEGKYAAALPLLRRAQTLKPRDNIQEYLEQVERVAQSR